MENDSWDGSKTSNDWNKDETHGSRKDWGKGKDKTPSPGTMRLNISPASPGRVVAPVVPVPTYSPAYAKGGMVRGCGKAVKGRGKVKVY